jgi:hypothetical protein
MRLRAPLFSALFVVVSGFAPQAVAWQAKLLAADTPCRTVKGNTFIAPAGWTLTVVGPATLLEPPEGGSAIVLVDVEAADADAAVAGAWKAYQPDARWPLKGVTPAPPRDGWNDRKTYSYQTSPDEQREVFADVRRTNGLWTVLMFDMARNVAEKRAAQVNLVFDKLLPPGTVRASPLPVGPPCQ